MQQRIMLIIASFLFLGIGIFAGIKISKKILPKGAPVGAENTYQSGWEMAMKTLDDSGVPTSLLEAKDVRNILGIVQVVSGKTITLKVITPGLMNKPELLTRTVNIESSTKIITLVNKDATKLKEERDSYAEKMKQRVNAKDLYSEDQSLAVSLQENKHATVNDLKVGQMISVQAVSNIRDAQKFVATEIQIQQYLQESVKIPQHPVSPIAPSSADFSEKNSPALVSPNAALGSAVNSY